MNSFVIVLFAAMAVAHAGIVVPAANILQGPSSRTTLVGPEGSVISSVAPGGQVITDSAPGAVAYTAPIVAPAAYAAPIVAPAAYAAPSIVAAGPVVAGGTVDTVLAGPSGTVAASRALTVSDVVGPHAGVVVV